MRMMKLKPIRTTGFVVAVVSALLIFSNVLAFTMLHYQTGGVSTSEDVLPDDLAAAYAKPVALISIALALAFLIAGIYLTRYRNWARVLAQAVAVLFFIHIWFQEIVLAGNNPFEKDRFSLSDLVLNVAWSVPFLLLAWYLSKEKVKQHFV